MSQADTILMMEDPEDKQNVPQVDTGNTIMDPSVQQEQTATPTPPPSYSQVVGDAQKQIANEIKEVVPPQQQAKNNQTQTPQQPSKPKDDGKKKIWIASGIGAVIGATLGVAGKAAASNLNKEEGEEEILLENETPNEESTGLFSEGLSGTTIEDDSLSFSEAFGNARNTLGANGVFKWRGKLYGTMLKDEWDNLSDEDRQQFAHHAQSVELEEDNNTDTAEDTTNSEAQEEVTTSSTSEEPNPTPPNPQYEVVEEDEEVTETNEIEEGTPIEDEEIEEGEPVDENEEEIEEGEPVEDEEIEEGEPVDENEEEIEEGEPVEEYEEEMIEEEEGTTGDFYYNIDEEDEYDDYENEEDPSDFM